MRADLLSRIKALCAGLLVALLLVGLLSGVPSDAATSGALVIVDTGNQIHRVVISFSGESIDGLEALRLAGASPETVGYGSTGTAVCKLFGVGHVAAPQTCLGNPSDQRYWAYYRSPSGANGFRYSGVGAGITRVRNGDVEGWKFGTGEAPPFSSYCEIAMCSNRTSKSGPPGSENSGGVSSSSRQVDHPQSSSSQDASAAQNTSESEVSAKDREQIPETMKSDEAGNSQDHLLGRGQALTATAGVSTDHEQSEVSWREVGSRRRAFPVSLVLLGAILGILASAIILSRRKRRLSA